jgi:hypothetical protein
MRGIRAPSPRLTTDAPQSSMTVAIIAVMV